MPSREPPPCQNLTRYPYLIISRLSPHAYNNKKSGQGKSKVSYLLENENLLGIDLVNPLTKQLPIIQTLLLLVSLM